MVIATKKTLTTSEPFRLPFKNFWTEKKNISYWPLSDFCPKIEFKWLKKFKMAVKIPESFTKY